jgi:hypothetical protein
VAVSQRSPHIISNDIVRLCPAPPSLTKTDTDGEVIFAAVSTLTHQVFNGLPNMNRTYFGLRHQYQN